jgi:acetyltransferase-like isoleucine patch superfamily enzyme
MISSSYRAERGIVVTLLYIWAKAFKMLRGHAVKNCSIHKTSKIQSGSNVIDSSMGKYTFCGYDCTIVNCEIGAFTSIADNVSIGDVNHPMDWVAMSPVFYAGRDIIKKKFSTHPLPEIPTTHIGNDVWIGRSAMIKAGISIGDGAVIGMGSIVTKDVAPYTIAAGCPARTIRMRFNDDTIHQLLATRWWDLSEEDIAKYAEHFDSPNIFIEKRGNDLEQRK